MSCTVANAVQVEGTSSSWGKFVPRTELLLRQTSRIHFSFKKPEQKKSPHAQSLSCMNPWYITLFAFINHIFLHSRLINHPGHCSTCSSCWSLETSFTNSFCAKSQHTSHHFLIMHRQPFMYRYISYRTIAMTSSYPEYSRANRTLSI